MNQYPHAHILHTERMRVALRHLLGAIGRLKRSVRASRRRLNNVGRYIKSGLDVPAMS